MEQFVHSVLYTVESAACRASSEGDLARTGDADPATSFARLILENQVPAPTPPRQPADEPDPDQGVRRQAE